MSVKRSARVTLRDIAAKAGLSLTATSMALRNQPGIAEATGEKVKQIAAELGYRPDARLSSLMQHLRTQQRHESYEVLAYVTSSGEDGEWKNFSQYDYYRGAAARATELGYRVEVFSLDTPRMTASRLSGILRARSVRGLMVGDLRLKHMPLRLQWDNFASITFSYTLAAPLLHRVTTDYYQEMLFVLKLLRGRGLSRIGFCINIKDDMKVQGLWRAAYLLFEQQLPPEDRVQLLEVNDAALPHSQPEQVAVNATLRTSPSVPCDYRKWLEANRPDCIISAGCDFPTDWEWMYKTPAPAAVRYVNMNIHHADARSQGIDQDSWGVGQVACDHLVAMLQRNERGLPARPQILTTQGHWVEDYTSWKKKRKESADL